MQEEQLYTGVTTAHVLKTAPLIRALFSLFCLCQVLTCNVLLIGRDVDQVSGRVAGRGRGEGRGFLQGRKDYQKEKMIYSSSPEQVLYLVASALRHNLGEFLVVEFSIPVQVGLLHECVQLLLRECLTQSRGHGNDLLGPDEARAVLVKYPERFSQVLESPEGVSEGKKNNV